MQTNKWNLLFASAVSAIFVVLGLVMSRGGLIGNDPYWYVADTESLLNGNGVQTNNILPLSVVNDTTVQNAAFVHNVPPVYIATVPGLFLGAFNGWLVMNAIFTALTTILFFLTLRRFFPPNLSGLIALQFLVMPLTLWLTYQPLAEAFQTVLLTSMLYVYYSSSRVPRYYLIGILTVALLLSRNNYVLVAVGIAILLYLEIKRVRGLLYSLLFLGSVLFLFLSIKRYFPDSDNFSFYYMAVSSKVEHVASPTIFDLINYYWSRALEFFRTQFIQTDFRLAVFVPFNLFVMGTIAFRLFSRNRTTVAPLVLVLFPVLFLLITTMLVQHQPRYMLPFYPLVILGFFLQAKEWFETPSRQRLISTVLVLTVTACLALDALISYTILEQGRRESARRDYYGGIFDQTIAADESMIYSRRDKYDWGFVMPAYLLRPRNVFVGHEELYLNSDRYSKLVERQNIKWLMTETNHGNEASFPGYDLTLEREIASHSGRAGRYLYRIAPGSRATANSIVIQAASQDTLNVRDFGAKGDGVTLDQAAIQAAIDRARSLGGGTVYFPDGTYLVSPHTAPIYVYSNLTLQGQSLSAVIKVVDNAGDYFKMIGTRIAIIENFTMRNLTIDQNPLGNRTCDVRFSVMPQITVYINKFKNVLVENCSFIHSGTNCLFVNDQTGVGGVTVRNNRFDFIPGLSSEPDFDNTAVCLVAKGQQVLGNTFTEHIASNRTAPITQKARTAIENDLGPAYTTGNSCDGYDAFVIISTAGANNVTVTGNTVTRAERGIILEPFSGYTMRSITLTNNTIKVSQKDWRSPLSTGIMCYQKKVTGGGFSGLTITGNRIEHQWDPTGYTMAWGGPLSAGISFCARANLENVTITNNVIINPPVHGIRIGFYDGYTRRNITIRGNQIFNPGLGKACYGYPVGIGVDGGTTYNLAIESNRIDTAKQYGGSYVPAFGGIKVQGTRGVTIKGNEISSVAKTAVQMRTIDSAFVTDNTLTGLPSNVNIGVLITGATNDRKSIVVTNNATTGFATPVRWSIAAGKAQ